MKEYRGNHRGHRDKKYLCVLKKRKKIKSENNDSLKKS
jgi:hypothetical protein